MTETHYLADILVLLAAAVITIPVFQRLGLGSVLGYLAAGAVVGPWGLGFIDQIEEIRHIAEFGVIFLLFIISIELKPARLMMAESSYRHQVIAYIKPFRGILLARSVRVPAGRWHQRLCCCVLGRERRDGRCPGNTPPREQRLPAPQGRLRYGCRGHSE